MKCMTCGKPISHLWESYIQIRDQYRKMRRDDLQGYQTRYGVSTTPENLALKEIRIINHETGIPWNPIGNRICCARHFLGCPEGLALELS